MVMVRVGLGNECKSNVMSPKVIKTQLQCACVCVRDPPISFVFQRMRGSELFSLANNEGDYCQSSKHPSLSFLLPSVDLVTVALN